MSEVIHQVGRPKRTVDLMNVIPVHADLQQLILKCRIDTDPFVPGGSLVTFSVRTYSTGRFKELLVSKSRRYHRYADDLGVVGNQLLQLSLAICCEIYSPSRAIREHLEFAGKYLIALPSREFHKTLYVPI